jgi:hypothetical protein
VHHICTVLLGIFTTLPRLLLIAPFLLLSFCRAICTVFPTFGE